MARILPLVLALMLHSLCLLAQNRITSAYNLSAVNISRSTTAYTSLGAKRSVFYYLPDLDVMALFRRGGPDDVGGPSNAPGRKVFFDFSPDGGSNWQAAKGKLHDNDDFANLVNGAATYGGQYPMGIIWNPPQNTNPQAAIVAGFVPVLNNRNVNYGGLAYNSTQLSNPNLVHKNIFDTDMPKRIRGYSLAQNAAGGIVHVELELDATRNQGGTTNSIYTGRSILTTFTVNPTSGAMSSEINYLNLGVDPDSIYAATDLRISFGPDGQTGYLTLPAYFKNTNLCPDPVFYPIVYKTSNGGNSWEGPFSTSLTRSQQYRGLRRSIMGDSTVYSPTNAVRNLYSMTPEHDAVVDKHGVLHVITTVAFAGADLGGMGPQVIDPNVMKHSKMVDLQFNPQTNSWRYVVLGQTQTYSGSEWDFGAIWYNRPQASRNKLGDKIFFTYFDTDTAKYATQLSNSQEKNNFPDMFMGGLDVTNPARPKQMRTRNVTHNTLLDGNMYLAASASLVKETAQEFHIPVVFAAIGATDGDPITHRYLQGVAVPKSPDTVFVNDPITFDTVITSTSAGVKARQSIRLYPNPAGDVVQIKGLEKIEGNASFTINDAFGRTALSGKVDVSASNSSILLTGLQSGIYHVTIKQGKQLVALRLVKE